MSEYVSLSAEKYYQEAKVMLEKKDLLGFVAKISVAIEAAGNDREMLAKATFILAEGLFSFNQHKKTLETIENALKYNSGFEAFTLKKHKGTVKGYLGNLDEAVRIFKELINETEDVVQLVSLYIYITWVHLSLDKTSPKEKNLQEVKHYLDLALEQLEEIPDELKWKTYNALSVYYFYIGEYDQAIETLESALPYCEEKDLPYVYGNLAENYLMFKDDDVSRIIHEYTEKAEVIASRYDDNIALARTFYTRAMSELKADELFTCLDILYLAFEHFKMAEAYPLAFECLVKINEIMNDYKIDRLRALKDSVKAEFNGTPYFVKL